MICSSLEFHNFRQCELFVNLAWTNFCRRQLTAVCRCLWGSSEQSTWPCKFMCESAARVYQTSDQESSRCEVQLSKHDLQCRGCHKHIHRNSSCFCIFKEIYVVPVNADENRSSASQGVTSGHNSKSPQGAKEQTEYSSRMATEVVSALIEETASLSNEALRIERPSTSRCPASCNRSSWLTAADTRNINPPPFS